MVQHPEVPALAIISAMITPALLIMATGNLIASTLTLHGRVIDRARSLVGRKTELAAKTDPDSVAFYNLLVTVVRRRLFLVQISLLGYYLATACFIASSIAIAYEELWQGSPKWLATALVVLGSLLLLASAVCTFVDTFLSTEVTRRELERDAL
jgi:Protein of unknown function (DUF2721)